MSPPPPPFPHFCFGVQDVGHSQSFPNAALCNPFLSHFGYCRRYDIKRNDDIITFFNDFSDHLAEEALWELSLKIKPRNITRRKTDREEKT